MREKGQENLVVSSSLVLSVISKDRFLAYYIDDYNARTMGDDRIDQKSQNWSHIFWFWNKCGESLGHQEKNLSTPSPAAVTCS